MIKPESESGYSAVVRGWLVIDEQSFDLAQVGRGHCVLKSPINRIPEMGQVIVEIDGHKSCRIVRLLHINQEYPKEVFFAEVPT